ncbi:hypothetical protein MACK_000302 [Theileria orientalis]|uniref:Uncharacterized protein n=1 Tax=Theileria orientalis TaxID=68886 RepID=A0A976QU89_THEOR|nr:hypothetical protein MACK_000302 [Theileria orientalis]
MYYIIKIDVKARLFFILIVLFLFLNIKVGCTHANKALNFVLNNNILYDLPRANSKCNKIKVNLLNSNDENDTPIIEKSNVYRDDRISITNNQNEIEVNETLLLESAKTYRSKLKLEDFMLDIFIENESNMKLINHQQLGKNKPTDIISIRDELRHIKSKYYLNRTPYKSKEQYHLGEIFLCPKYIEKMSEMELMDEKIPTKEVLKMNKSGGVATRIQGVRDINTRMCLLLAHGILHLLGYDHISVEDYKEMEREEDSLLDTLIDDIIERNS